MLARLALLVLIGSLVGYTSAALLGCGPGANGLGAAKSAVVDCTTASASKLIAEFTPAVAQVLAGGRAPDGSLADSAIAALKSLGRETGACVLADLAGRAVTGMRPLVGPPVDPDTARAALARVRVAWPGATFRTEAGTL